MFYIEDLLHIVVDEPSIEVLQSDTAILKSISQQCKKGIALTDRQLDLIKNKIVIYADKLQNFCPENVNNVILESVTRLPLRVIDREKIITVVSNDDLHGPGAVYETFKTDWFWIRIKFPFSKKDIVKVESIINDLKNRREYYHIRGSHEHYFKFTGLNSFLVFNKFKDSQFVISDQIVEFANKTKHILDNRDNYIQYIKDNKFVNFKNSVQEQILNEIGDIESNKMIYKDRSKRYNFVIEDSFTDNSLTSQIVSRESTEFLVDPKKYNMDQIAKSIYDLKRFPLLVVIDQDDSYSQLLEIHQAFNYLVEPSQQSVLFREDSDSNDAELNDYIQKHKLNNWVDKDTKIVYIKKNKLPKVLLKSEFNPITALGKTSMRSTSNVRTYIEFFCDLILYNDSAENNFFKFRNRLGL